MATWKKLVVSGSNISQLNNDAGYISASQVPAAGPSFSTASINGVQLLADSPSGSFTFNTASGEAAINLSGNAGTDTIEINLIDGGIANAKLANSSVHISGSGISAASVALGATASIDVQVDDSTIEIASDKLALKSGSVSIGHLSDALVVTAAEGIANNDNDTTIATNAAIIDYVESASAAAGALSVAGDGSTSTSIDLDTQTFTLAGESGIVAASASAQTITVSLVDGGVTNAKLTNDSITIGAHEVALGESVTLAETGFNSGSFSGSFQGDGSQLTGIATSLDVSGSDGTGITIDLKTQDLTIGGTANEIETTTSGQTVTIGLPDDVTITQDLTVNRNLTVIGTASFQHETNLEVADRFIRLASGSAAAGDGGIVIQQSSDGTGEVFGFDDPASRWAISSSFDASNSSFTAEAFMAAVLTGAANTDSAIQSAVPDTRYNAKGNIWIADSQDIWIYS